LLHQAPEGGTHVTVVHDVVVDLRQDGVGVEIEPMLGSVPT